MLEYRASVRWRLLLVATLATACSPAPADVPAGTTIVGGDLPACADCLRTVSAIAMDRRPQPGWPQSLVRDEHGRLFLASRERRGLIDIYAPDGRWIGTIGGRGTGEGQYLAIRHLLLRDGYLEIIDGDYRRRTVLDSAGEVARTSRVRTNPDAALALPGDSLVVAGGSTPFDVARDAVAVLDPAGEVARTFAAADTSQTGSATPFRRRLALSEEGIWVAHRDEYRLQLWSLDGTLVAEILRTPSWFEPHSGRRLQPVAPPSPQIEALREDGEGLLWVAITVPDARWREQFTDRPEDFAFNREYGAYLDTVIEVLDPRAGTIVASIRLDPVVTGFLGDDEVIAFHKVDGEPRVEVIQLRLRR